MSQPVAVTGGSGFIGAAVIDALLAEGFDVRALARSPQKFAKWRGRVDLMEGSLDNRSTLDRLADGAACVINAAGVTHAWRDADYVAVNVDGAARAAQAAAKGAARFVHLSSISARVPFASAYSGSKFASEGAIRSSSGSNRWIALRVPAVYGPRDRVALPYFRMVKAGLAPEPITRPPAKASLVFVDDLAAAVVAAARTPIDSGVYDIGDDAPEGRSWEEIGRTLAQTMGVRARRVRLPRPAVAVAQSVTFALERLSTRTPSVRSGQTAELFHPDWVAGDPLFSAVSGWRARTPLAEGFAKTVRWYQDNGLL